MSTVRIAASQAPEFVGDVAGALAFLNAVSDDAKAQGVALLVFPEGFLQGYIVQEKQAREVAIDLGSLQFQELLTAFPVSGPMLVVGLITMTDGCLFNTAVVVKDQRLIGSYQKRHLLPREAAFVAGRDLPIFDVQGLKFCINICYDTNFPTFEAQDCRIGAGLILCCANNMLQRETAEKYKQQHNLARGERCKETGLWLVSSDVTGVRDGCLALGPTAVLNPDGDVVAQLPLGQTGLLVFDLPKPP